MTKQTSDNSESPTPSGVVANFLKSKNSPHAKHFHPDLELQVVPVSEEQAYEIDSCDFSSCIIRVPKDGNKRPIDVDFAMYRPEFIQRIGTSGWNWKEQCSEFVIFDLDGKDHGDNGLSDKELKEAVDAVSNLPYVEVYSSKGGVGRHFYVHLKGHVPAKVRSEHRLVAHAVLAIMSRVVGRNLAESVDVFGGIGWLWDRDAKENGFQLIQPASEKLLLSDNWQELAAQQQQRNRGKRLTTNARRNLEGMMYSQSAALNDRHHKTINWLEEHGWACEVSQGREHQLVQVHTVGLMECHKALELRGVFESNSTGSDPQKPNAFAFPREDGGFDVRRYGNAAEASCWQQDSGGWTHCIFDGMQTLRSACEVAGGTVDDKGRCQMTPVQATNALNQLGLTLEVPDQFQDRNVTVWQDGPRVYARVRAQDAGEEYQEVPGWRYYRKNWDHTVEGQIEDPKPPSLEHCIRRVGQQGASVEWQIMNNEGKWIKESLEPVKAIIRNRVGGGRATDATVAFLSTHNWTRVFVPFGKEYPEGIRVWNREAPQLAFDPLPGPHGSWDMVLDHLGSGINEAVEQDEWCKDQGVLTGADYLRLYMASILRQPKQSLPYLFLYSEKQNTGKSTFYRAFRLLLEDHRGCVELKRELKDDFNGIMEGAVLCYIDEFDLGSAPGVYNQIKNLVDGDHMNLRGMRQDGRMVENYTHFVQCANKLHFCPVPPGDTRIVVIHVRRPDGERPWQRDLKPALKREAPAFTDTLLSLKLPEQASGRLYLPVLMTQAKIDAMAALREAYRTWFDDLCDLAEEGEIQSLTAAEMRDKLDKRTNDSNLPGNPGGLVSALMAKTTELGEDNLFFKKAGEKITIDRGSSLMLNPAVKPFGADSEVGGAA